MRHRSSRGTLDSCGCACDRAERRRGTGGPGFGRRHQDEGSSDPRPAEVDWLSNDWAERLGFTDGQKTAFQSLLTEERTTLKSTADGLRQAQQALDSAVMQIPVDDGLLQSQVAAVSAAQAQIALARAQTEAKIYQLLTPDQQQKAQQWLADMQQRRQQRGGRAGR